LTLPAALAQEKGIRITMRPTWPVPWFRAFPFPRARSWPQSVFVLLVPLAGCSGGVLDARRSIASADSKIMLDSLGLALAAVLTVGSFYVVRTTAIWGPGIAVALAVLAIAQIGVHLVLFLATLLLRRITPTTCWLWPSAC
jgi:hypothetical protein